MSLGKVVADHLYAHASLIPELRRSVKVDLLRRTAQERSYDAGGNPPILHRKETLLPPAHPGWVQFAALTFA